MERYGTHCEQTYRTNFNRSRAKYINWVKFNLSLSWRYLNMDGLLAGAYFIPYPETISAKVQMTNAHQGTIDVPYKYVNAIARGMTASIEVEGYDAETYGAAKGEITATSHTPRQTATGSVFAAQVRITDCKYKIVSGMTDTASILVSNGSVLQRIIQRISPNRETPR